MAYIQKCKIFKRHKIRCSWIGKFNIKFQYSQINAISAIR